MIKLPDSLINSQYKIEAFVPEPKVLTKKNENGSFSLSVEYDVDAVSKMCKQVAHDMCEQFDKAIIEELLELNGYVKERTCHTKATNKARYPFVCSECGCVVAYETGNMSNIYVPPSNAVLLNYCPNCGAKVVR